MSTDDRRRDEPTIGDACERTWESLDRTDEPGDKQRYCGDCKLHVLNFARMTRREIDATVAERGEGRLCARILRGPDGGMITLPEPRRPRRVGAVAAALLGAAGTLGLAGCEAQEPVEPPQQPPEHVEVVGIVAPEPPPGELLGEVCVPEEATHEPVEELGDVEARPQEMLGRIALPTTPDSPDATPPAGD